MPSPFPGVDPYVESLGLWPDLHASLIIYCRDALSEQLPDHYVARIDERFTMVEVPHSKEKLIRPDIAVERDPSAAIRRPAPQASGALTLEPVTIALPASLVETRETCVEIRRLPDWELVTVIELLSPSNKNEPGFSEYQSKRRGLIRNRVNLVELDLLLGGRRLPFAGPLPPADYYAFVTRSDRLPDCDVYFWMVRNPLPTIPIPLRDPDPDVPLDLAAIFTSAYKRGRYARTINYQKPLVLPLSPDDRAWAEEQARATAG